MGKADVQIESVKRIFEDLSCGGCGYNLRGKAISETCPECGMNVSRSAREDLLRYSDPGWLRTLANGLVAFMICAALALAFKIAYAYGLHRIINAPVAPQSITRWDALIWFSFSTTLVLHALTLIGVWMITRREPRREHEPRWMRKTARLAFCTSAILWSAGWLPWLGSAITGGRWFNLALLHYIVQWSAGVASLIGVVVLFLLARRMAFRLPDESLARRTVIAAMGITAIMVFEGVYSWTNFFGLFFTISGEASRYIVHLPQAIVTAWAIVLLMQYRARIRAVK